MMDVMIERRRGPDRRCSTRSNGSGPGIALVVSGLLLAAACGGDAEPAARAAIAAPTSTAAAAPSTVRPSTTARATTSTRASTTASSTPSTTAPTTTSTTTPTTTPTTTSTSAPLSTIALEHAEPVGPATEPIAPPSDPYAAEPIVELGSLAIPKLGVEMTMYEGIRLTTLDNGPGHWPGSALPGQLGNVVVGGHRTSKHQVFRHVDRLVPGDEIVFTDDAGRHVYLVDRVEIVEPTDVWIVDPTATPTATLFACHPPGSTAQRIAVFADLAG